MGRTANRHRVVTGALLLLLLALAAGCGQKGDLYLPDAPPDAVAEDDDEEEES